MRKKSGRFLPALRSALLAGPAAPLMRRILHRRIQRRAAAWQARVNARLAGIAPAGQTVAGSVTVDAGLPRLAWRATLNRELELAVHCGAGVEVFEGGIVEGVWAGAFDAFDFAASAYRYGSGLRYDARGITLCPPSHMFEGVFMLRDKKRGALHFANTLAHCLAAAGLDENSGFLRAICAEVSAINDTCTRLGVLAYDPQLIEDDDYALYVFYFHNVSIEPGRGLRVHARPELPEFSDFQGYREFLLTTLRALAANGAAAGRGRPQQLLSTVSQGYDSPAVSALAAAAGCDMALTVGVTVYGNDDSGAEVARHLGLDCRECRHPAGAAIDNLHMTYGDDLYDTAREFLATQGFGDDVVFAAFEPYLENRILLTGAMGDSVWDIRSNLPAGLPIRVRYGKSLAEYRVRLGFAHVPVPTIGALAPAPIAAISATAAMRPYAVGGRYDRPIARRLAEEAGVPRDAFGRRKNATNPHPINFESLKQPALVAMLRTYRASLARTDGGRERRSTS